ncbi:hypothetical protein [Bradyrhizobium sp. G127]|uniref:hypothetical protein n=1 Tax=Bradyrhizobium sp. G127 TaxID=2904800 RepID=UPI001F33CB6E|nr:hypothetical protein [Bradyrhizobium sp. G127]MCF2523909.1 hypothetical protein [Bradyrhizobium sp. G127]
MSKPKVNKRIEDMSVAERLAAMAGPEISEEDRAAKRRASFEIEQRREQERRANAFPILAPDEIVRTSVFGWKYVDSRVVNDDGPAHDGSRKITLEKIGRAERCTLRRDRVRVVPAQ